MKKEDLIEFLSSTIEGGAIVSRLYNLFHNNYGYDIKLLEDLVQYGVKHNYFIIENVNNSEEVYTEVDWKENNNYQEVIMNNQENFLKQLFSEKSQVPKEFIQFLGR